MKITQIKKYEKLGIVLVLAVILGNFLLYIFNHKDTMFRSFEPKVWEDKYNASQWVIPYSKNEISDEDLYIHVGHLLATGSDPASINAEVPPLAKYMLGIVQRITGNTGAYGILMSAVGLILFYILNTALFKNRFVALVPVAIFSFDPIFQEQIGASMLDSAYLVFLLATFIFIVKKKYMWAGVAAGCFMATKSPFMIPVLYAAIWSYLLLTRTFTVRRALLMGVSTGVVYYLSYISLFFVGHDVLYFFRVQKYIYSFYRSGAQGTFGAVFPLLFSGYWFTWFNKDGFIKQWSVLWPISSILSLGSVIAIIKKRDFTNPFTLLIVWLVFYFAFLTIVPVFPRYLLLALPFMYNLSVWGILKIVGNYMSQRS